MKKASLPGAFHRLDGALGTALLRGGLCAGVCPEEWILSDARHTDLVRDLQRDYIRSGAQLLYAPSFGANRITLSGYGLGDRVAELNAHLAEITRKVADEAGDVLVGGDLSQTGLFVRPLGTVSFEDLVEIYREQVASLAPYCDLFCAETLLQLTDARAAFFACRDVAPEKPFFASFTVEPGSRRTLAGTDVGAAAATLYALGADAVGVNCSAGPSGMEAAVRAVDAVRSAGKLVIAKPNAGLPDEQNNFSLSVAEFARQARLLVDCGADLLGGCCGTTPAHLSALFAKLPDSFPPRKAHPQNTFLCSERTVVSRAQVVFPEPKVCDASLLSTLDFSATALSLFLKDEAGLSEFTDAIPYLSGMVLQLGAATDDLLQKALYLYPGCADTTLRVPAATRGE